MSSNYSTMQSLEKHEYFVWQSVPQHMSKDKKEECEKWHAEQVIKGETTWNFQREPLEYCQSDDKLLYV